ncbi:hypothetical protein NDU88_002552 [Pleurodeles waltl]|uniref:Uncharacterized protein n=1 Tax=Pleurodeles waltl TaxID=8319 RepID=A0AAV7TNF2_PLEWA|nr:hypothetical protein NDU88_002552 [Pleurodeles waltl]
MRESKPRPKRSDQHGHKKRNEEEHCNVEGQAHRDELQVSWGTPSTVRWLTVEGGPKREVCPPVCLENRAHAGLRETCSHCRCSLVAAGDVRPLLLLHGNGRSVVARTWLFFHRNWLQ